MQKLSSLKAMSILILALPLSAQYPSDHDELAWVEPQLPSDPSARCCMAMTYDASTQSILLFGGGNGGVEPRVTYNDTWIWRNGWVQQAPATSPSARQGSGMAYDPNTGTVVLFGGGGESGDALNDTWTWDGQTWTQQFPAVSPPGREWDIQGMAYDPATETVLAFGGLNLKGGVWGDTWEWNGKAKTWTQQFPAASPSARRGMLTYDDARNQIMLFGGDNGAGDCCATYFDDTWTWDGKTWTQQFPLSSPPARTDSPMEYDSAAGQVVLFGGFNVPGQGLDDTWTWDGTTWLDRQMNTEPSGRWACSMVYTPQNYRLVLFGGEITGDPFVNETWFLVPDQAN